MSTLEELAGVGLVFLAFARAGEVPDEQAQQAMIDALSAGMGKDDIESDIEQTRKDLEL